jgi:hypothetical protein
MIYFRLSQTEISSFFHPVATVGFLESVSGNTGIIRVFLQVFGHIADH